MRPFSEDADPSRDCSRGSPGIESLSSAGGVIESVVSSKPEALLTTPGLQRSSPSRSADTELAPLSRAGRDGSDWKTSISNVDFDFKLVDETGLVSSLGLDIGVSAAAPIDVELVELTEVIVGSREGGDGVYVGSGP